MSDAARSKTSSFSGIDGSSPTSIPQALLLMSRTANSPVHWMRPP